MSIHNDPTHLFTLNVRVWTGDQGERPVIIHAFDSNRDMGSNHFPIEVEVRHCGKVIFPRGQLCCGVTANHSTDGRHARELVMSLVAMKPGDTDSEYFADYTFGQLEWVEKYADALTMARLDRYCDQETGEVRE